MTHEIPRRHALPMVIGSVLVVAWLTAPRVSLPAPDPPPGNEVCLQCHEDRAATLAATAHAVARPEAPKAKLACYDCHPGDHRHWEGEPQGYPMPNGSKMQAAEEARLCAACHANAHRRGPGEVNVHTRNEVGCSGCHSIHAAKHEPLLVKRQPELCLGCHGGVEGQFARPYRHPVADGVVACSECHTTLDQPGREFSLDGTSPCGKCHGEFAGPFLHEHPATLEFSNSEGGCLACHDAHGSNQPRMLKQPYEPPHYQLCSQCHSVPRHQANVMHGTAWAGMPCNECHADIHGSNTSRHFLTQSLAGRGCFNVGCHTY